MRLQPMRYEGVSLARRTGSLMDLAMLALASFSTSPSSLGCLVKAPTWSSRMPQRRPRRRVPVTGRARCSQRSGPLMARSIRRMTQGGVRWKRVSLPTRGWMAGTIWMAEAPVPIMATRLPVRS